MGGRVSSATSTARITSALAHLDCSRLERDEWLRVGMALKAEGFGCEAWDSWSATDRDRYHEGECASLWDGFNSDGVTGGTVCYLAELQGWDGSTEGAPRLTTTHKRKTRAAQQFPTITGTTDPAPLDQPPTDPADMLRAQLDALFLPDELLNVNVRGVEWDAKQGKYVPTGWGEFLRREDVDTADLLAHVNAKGGAFVRVNPMDGKGGSNANATAYRTALIECDGLDKETQLAEYRRLNLPCACIVDSGNKSVHAFVRIDARDRDEYRERVRWLHGFLNVNLPTPKDGKHPVDPNNKNPARWARMAGARRGESVQRLVSTACGASGWDEWRTWVDAMAHAGMVPADEPLEADAYETDECCTEAQEDAEPPMARCKTQAALVEFIRTDEWLRSGFGTNMLDGGRYVTGPLPWDELGEGRRWTDADKEHLWCYLQEHAGARSRRDVEGAFTIAAAENRFNPIADMLDALPEWDGTARADYLLWALFGCEDNEYTRAVSHAFMRGAVLRAYEPACKFDSVLTLIGPQGCGKSYGTRQLVMGHDALLCESVTDLTDLKLAAEQTGGKWIVELAELEGMTGRRLTAVKQAITMQSITVRMAYAREAIDLPRSCVFVATTNEAEFLADPTGARRFWPIRCAVDTERDGWAHASAAQVRAFITQAWAEVVGEYKTARATSADADELRASFPTTLTAEAEAMADAARDAASVEDTRVGVIREWLEDVRMRDGVTRITSRMVAERALGVDMTRQQRGNRLTTEISFILNNLCPDWEPIGKQRVAGYGVCRTWEWRGTDK